MLRSVSPNSGPIQKSFDSGSWLHSSSHSLPPSPIFSGARQGPLLSTTMFRTLLRPFAIYAAYSPIETIVFFFVVGTLAYFNILSAIKNSAFLATPYPSGNPYASTDVLQTPITDSFAPVADALPTDSALSGGVRPAFAVFRNEKWVQARESDWIYREEENVEGSVELQPLVFALEVSLRTVFTSSPASLFCPGMSPKASSLRWRWFCLFPSIRAVLPRASASQ